MSAIGDYVHLAIGDAIFPGGKETGYKTGNAPDGYNQKMKLSDANEIFTIQKNHIKTFAQMEEAFLAQEAADIQKNMQELMLGKGDADSDFNKMIELISQKLGIEIDNNLKVMGLKETETTKGSLAIKSLRQRWERLQKNKKSVQYDTLKTIINELESAIDEISSLKMIVNGANLNQDLKNLRNIRTRLKNIEKKIIPNNSKSSSLVDLTGEKYNIQNLYKSAINTLSHYSILAASTSDKGDVLEFLVAMCACYCADQEYNIEDNWRKLVSGGQATHLTYESSNFDSEKFNFTKTLSSLKGYQEQNGFIVRTAGSSKDKVDVYFGIGGSAISAKNYSKRGLLKGINRHPPDMFGGVSGSPLLYLIQNEDHDFVNHWINVTIAHPDGNIDKSLVNYAHRAMIITLIAKGMYGEVLKSKRSKDGQNISYESANISDKANFLLWNNSDSGEVKVLPLGTILYHMIEKVDSSIPGSYGIGKSYSQNFINNNSYNWGIPNNNGHKAARKILNGEISIETRLNILLLHMHNSKITTYISAAPFY